MIKTQDRLTQSCWFVCVSLGRGLFSFPPPPSISSVRMFVCVCVRVGACGHVFQNRGGLSCRAKAVRHPRPMQSPPPMVKWTMRRRLRLLLFLLLVVLLVVLERPERWQRRMRWM